MRDYKRVEADGLPTGRGKYFLIMSDNELILADLELEGTIRVWCGYPNPLTIDESKIRKWKRIEYVSEQTED